MRFVIARPTFHFTVFFTCLVFLLISTHLSARDLEKEYAKAKFKIGSVALEAFVADTDPLREQGLMFIEKLPRDTGMLFVFEHEQTLRFWMKNTIMPLSIGFFNSKGVLVDVQEMQIKSLMDLDVPTYQSRAPALFALEMERGWFTKQKLAVNKNTPLCLRPAARPESKLLREKLPVQNCARP